MLGGGERAVSLTFRPMYLYELAAGKRSKVGGTQSRSGCCGEGMCVKYSDSKTLVPRIARFDTGTSYGKCSAYENCYC